MDTSVQNPSCISLFEPTAPECMQCGIQAECMKEQEKCLKACVKESSEQNSNTDEPEQIRSTNESEQEEVAAPKSKKQSNPPGKEENLNKHKPTIGDAQFIPQHQRQPLEIPPVGSTIKTTFKGKTYEAVIVDDPHNKRGDGRSVLFNGTVYRTLTAAAHAISPGINSGSVWQQV